MAEVGLVASIAGLISLGLEVTKVINLYIASASNANERIREINIDVKLVTRVVTQLEATLDDPASKSLISSEAESIGKDAVLLCHEKFAQIKQKLTKAGKPGFRKRDKFWWPFKEPEVERIKAHLESAKSTLQLLLDVIMFADLKKRHADEFLLQERKRRIRESKRNLDKAKAKVEALGSSEPLTVATDDIRSVATELSLIPDSDRASDVDGSDYHSYENEEAEETEEILRADYDICLSHLKVLQRTIENALMKLDPTSTKRMTAKAQLQMIKNINRHGRDTHSCLEERLLQSQVHLRLLGEQAKINSGFSTPTMPYQQPQSTNHMPLPMNYAPLPQFQQGYPPPTMGNPFAPMNYPYPPPPMFVAPQPIVAPPPMITHHESRARHLDEQPITQDFAFMRRHRHRRSRNPSPDADSRSRARRPDYEGEHTSPSRQQDVDRLVEQEIERRAEKAAKEAAEPRTSLEQEEKQRRELERVIRQSSEDEQKWALLQLEREHRVRLEYERQAREQGLARTREERAKRDKEKEEVIVRERRPRVVKHRTSSNHSDGGGGVEEESDAEIDGLIRGWTTLYKNLPVR